LQRQQRVEHLPSVILTPHRGEIGERVDDQQIHVPAVVDAADLLQERQPLFRARLAPERPAEPAQMIVEGEELAALVPTTNLARPVVALVGRYGIILTFAPVLPILKKR
jgi:hypothetical protein